MTALTQNQVDPSKTLDIRKKYTNQQRRIFATAVTRTEEALANLPDNPTQNQIEDYISALLLLLMLPLSNGTSVYPYVQAAYLRGVTNANLDLRAGGIAVDGAEFAVLTQAVHRFSLQARQDQTQAILRDVYMGTVSGVRGEFGQVVERPLVDRVKTRLKQGLTLAAVVGGTALVGIVADAFLNRVTDFGIALVSAVAEARFTTMGDERVCIQCQELETRDNGNGPGIYTIQEARGIIPVHFGCRCNWSAIVLGKDVPFLRF
jgi:hypothetical protein